MKTFACYVSLALLMVACDEPAATTTKEQSDSAAAAKVAAPAPLDSAQAAAKAAAKAVAFEKMEAIGKEYEKVISTKFWSDFTNTTRRGGKGTTEVVFDSDAYGAYLKKKGFEPIPTGMMDYKGKIDNIEVSIINQAISGEHGGWVQKFTMNMQDSSAIGVFKKKHSFYTSKE